MLIDFQNPPAEYRPQPLWVWNNDMSRARITKMLEDFAAQGMGGVFVHPRAGLVTDYLSETWFELWGFALAEAKRLGLFCHIYDENSYPSGFAGGHTVASNPLLAGTCLKRKRLTAPAPSPKRDQQVLLALHRAAADGSCAERLEPGEFGRATPEAPHLALIEQPLEPAAFRAHFPFVDLLRREVTERFLELTHDRYAAHFSDDLGGAIRFAFADEPLVCGGGLPMSGHLRRVFQRDRGYELVPHLEDLFTDSATASQTRFDYWLTVHELFVSGYLQPCHDWCDAHGIAFTGHFHETSWPSPKNQPSTMAALRWLQAPGNDLLGFQFNPKKTLRDNGIYLLNLKELDSVKRQCGRNHSVVETTGGGGYESGPREFKPLEDFVLSQGVNLINPHLSHSSVAGARKYDWAHTISDHAPWFDGYRPYADHLARTNLALSQGEAQHPILLLHPSSSGWITYTGVTEGLDTGKPVMNPAAAALRDSQIDLICSLYSRGLGFDLGDELMLAEIGATHDAQLMIGPCAYETVILPRGTSNFLAAALPPLEAFVAAGGRLLAETGTVPLIDGRPSERLNRLLGENAQRFTAREHLLHALTEIHPPTLQAAQGHLGDLCWREIQTERKASVLFLCNPFDRPYAQTIDLGEEPRIALDTTTGQSGLTFEGPTEIQLAPHDHLLLLPNDLATDLPKAPAVEILETAQPLNFVEALPVGPNIWALDYADLTVAGETHRGLNTFHADDRNWQEQGFRKNPWSFSIQFRQNFLQAACDPEAAFTIEYPFTLDEMALATRERYELAVEQSHLYTIHVNDRTCDFSKARSWFDETIRAAPIGAHLRAGENRITLHCQPFHALAEIMPVYLLGDFTLRPFERGFTAVAPRPLNLGDWTEQGRPFDPLGVRYRFRVLLAEPTRRIRLELPGLAGSLARVTLAGQSLGQIYREPFIISSDIDLPRGEHPLDIEVRGNLKNLMGPHHSDGLPGPWSWNLSPKTQPAGGDYRRCPTGLIEPPQLYV